jgi:hypothetical protein
MVRNPAWLAAGLLLFVVLACNFTKRSTNSTNNSAAAGNSNAAPVSTSTGALSEIYMARDDGSGDPGEKANTFDPKDRTIHCVTKLKDARSGTKMRFSCFAVDAKGAKNEKLKDIDYTTRTLENVVHGHLTAPGEWRAGRYRVEVYVNGNLEEAVHYTVE